MAKFWHVFRVYSTDSDDCTHVYALKVNAVDGAAAVRAVMDYARDGDGGEWREALEWDRPERADATAFYRTSPCGCGEDGCDETHEPRTVLCEYVADSSHETESQARRAQEAITSWDTRHLSLDASDTIYDRELAG